MQEELDSKNKEIASLSNQVKDLKEDDILSTGEVLSRFSETVKVDEKEELDIKNGKILEIQKDSQFNKLLIINSLNEAVAMYTRKSKNEKFIFARGLF